MKRIIRRAPQTPGEFLMDRGNKKNGWVGNGEDTGAC